MTPGRYVRLVKGAIVVQRHDLQGVVAHLHDLARHLEAMIPSDDDMATLIRSRDFAGGFAQRAQYEADLDHAVIEALSERREDHPYAPIRIEGYSLEQVEAAVLRLWKAGLVDAHSQKPQQVVPSSLTTRGFRELQRYEKTLTKGA